MRGSSVGGRRGESAGEPQVERERLACDWVAGRMMTVDSSGRDGGEVGETSF